MAFTPAKPWNFPMLHVPGNVATSAAAVWYTDGNNITDFTDTGSVFAVGAIFCPYGFNASAMNYDTTYPVGVSTYQHVFSLGRKESGSDNRAFMRTIWDQAASEARIQCYVYDGTSYFGLTITPANLGWDTIEGRVLQIAMNLDGVTGDRQVVVNGQFFSTPATAWSTLNLHTNSNARMVINHRANWTSNNFTADAPVEWFLGPLLVDDTPRDLTPEGTTYNRIFDANGDFLWAGEDGALWLSDDGLTKPWYFSQNTAPLPQRGTMTATWAAAGTTYYGSAYGCKEDFKEGPFMPWVRANMPGIEVLWDMTLPYGVHNTWWQGEGNWQQELRQVSPNSYTIHRCAPCIDDGRVGSLGWDHEIVGNYGWATTNTGQTIGGLPALATQLSMTYTMDFTDAGIEVFGYRKIAGWGNASSSANFRVTGPWPSGSSRHYNIAVYPENSAQFYMGYTVPNNTGYTVWTWQWDNGLMKCWVNGVVRSTVDRTGTDTRLNNSTYQEFGFRSGTSSSSGTNKHRSDFFMVNSVALSDQQIIDLHNKLRGIT